MNWFLMLSESTCKITFAWIHTSSGTKKNIFFYRKKESKKGPEASGSSTSIDVVDTASVATVDDEASSHSDSMPVPQLKLGPDGNIVLNAER